MLGDGQISQIKPGDGAGVGGVAGEGIPTLSRRYDLDLLNF